MATGGSFIRHTFASVMKDPAVVVILIPHHAQGRFHRVTHSYKSTDYKKNSFL